MGGATYAVPNFLGGEISQFAQGRFDRPDYRFSLNICLNAFPGEIGCWMRRPGTQHAGSTRRGVPGRVIKFDFEQADPYTVEIVDSWMRFRAGPVLSNTNDSQAVLSISTANPAVVQTSSATGWNTNDTVMFSNLGVTAAPLQNREFVITVVDSTHFSLTSAIGGVTVNGAMLGSLPFDATVSRVQEVASPYTISQLPDIRPVQAETTTILLHGKVVPQALTVPGLPTPTLSANFDLNPATFLDGPYLDPVAGSLATPSGVSGNITVTLSFQAYSSTQGYSKGNFVTSSGVGYQSLQDANVGNTPASSPLFWAVASPGLAVGPNGIVQTDIGRHVRFNDSAGNWTWGKITGLSNVGIISVGGFPSIGNLTGNGGLPAIFDGVVTKPQVKCGLSQQSFTPPPSGATGFDLFAGKNFTGTPTAVQYAYVVPSSDLGLVQLIGASGASNVQISLRGSNSAPATAGSGTLLGDIAAKGAYGGNSSPYVIPSNDTVSTWNYIWIEITFDLVGQVGDPQMVVVTAVAQVEFYGSSASTAGTVFTMEILGPILPNTSSVIWQIGAYSNTTGWPTCGAYHEGRLWLGGAIDNRFDASVSNGITSGSTINFAPTNSAGQVLDSSAISYTLNSDGVNPIFWMEPDLQGLIFGTQAGEWLTSAPSAGAMTPTNIASHRVTRIGCANVEPRRTEHTNVFVQRYTRKLMEYFTDVYSGKFSAPNIADKAEHITSAGIVELAYQQAQTPVIWGRDGNNALFGVTYKRDTLTTAQGPTYAAWHRHTLGSGRTVESICTGPSVGGSLDALTMVTNDPISNIRHVEILTDSMDELSPISDAWFLDDAVVPSSTVSSSTAIPGAPYGGLTINGLWHLNGKTVQVFASGLDCGDPGEGKAFSDFLVTNGSCFVPFGDGLSAGAGRGLFTAAFAATASIVVGLTFTSQGQLVRPISPADSGARNGPALGKIRRNHRIAMLLNNTQGISIGATFDNMVAASLVQSDGVTTIYAPNTFSGVQQDSVPDDYSYDGMLCWQVSRPFPANVIAISGNIESQDQ